MGIKSLYAQLIAGLQSSTLRFNPIPAAAGITIPRTAVSVFAFYMGGMRVA
jgi:hypothetical protein